ncbi:MAG: ABC transporter ATP-binding protein [Spirochaetaceae bacterium]|nr:MAG: ABC transporter ATP-binding protein [Spirochaetaceae bacterium]
MEIKSLSFGYTKERLFSNLDLSLHGGNIYGLLGKNGAGKTTLLKLISGLRFPESGECRVLGLQPQHRPAALLEDIYFLPEEFYTPPISGELYRQIYAPFYPRFSVEAFQEYLKEFDLPPRKKLSEMSYGQKKKFLLAFALATRCRLVLLDEPTNGLDIPSKSQFRKLLARAGAEDRIILISTHQVRDMENLIDPVIILDEGRIIFQQPMHEVIRRLQVEIEAEQPSGDGVLYAEKALGGYVVVRKNTGGEETQLDLETLFNTVIASRDRIDELFVEEV